MRLSRAALAGVLLTIHSPAWVGARITHGARGTRDALHRTFRALIRLPALIAHAIGGVLGKLYFKF